MLSCQIENDAKREKIPFINPDMCIQMNRVMWEEKMSWKLFLDNFYSSWIMSYAHIHTHKHKKNERKKSS